MNKNKMLSRALLAVLVGAPLSARKRQKTKASMSAPAPASPSSTKPSMTTKTPRSRSSAATSSIATSGSKPVTPTSASWSRKALAEALKPTRLTSPRRHRAVHRQVLRLRQGRLPALGLDTPIAGLVRRSDDSGSDPTYGVGLQYRFNDAVALRGEYSRFEVNDLDLDLAQLQVRFDF